MVFTGYDHKAGDPTTVTKWRVENSWGDGSEANAPGGGCPYALKKDGGFYLMTDEWFSVRFTSRHAEINAFYARLIRILCKPLGVHVPNYREEERPRRQTISTPRCRCCGASSVGPDGGACKSPRPVRQRSTLSAQLHPNEYGLTTEINTRFMPSPRIVSPPLRKFQSLA